MLNQNHKCGRFDRSRLDVAISEVLYWAWDPLGVNEFEYSARDEYDNYVMSIKGILIQDVIAAVRLVEVQKILAEIQTDYIGLRPNEAVDRDVAERLVGLLEHCK